MRSSSSARRGGAPRVSPLARPIGGPTLSPEGPLTCGPGARESGAMSAKPIARLLSACGSLGVDPLVRSLFLDRHIGHGNFERMSVSRSRVIGRKKERASLLVPLPLGDHEVGQSLCRYAAVVGHFLDALVRTDEKFPRVAGRVAARGVLDHDSFGRGLSQRCFGRALIRYLGTIPRDVER